MPSRPEPERTAAASVEQSGEVCRLGGTLDFDTARAALETVVPLIERGAISSVDLAGVTKSNSAALALMIEWLATARRAGRPLRFSGVPDGLRQLAGVCQVDALFGAMSPVGAAAGPLGGVVAGPADARLPT